MLCASVGQTAETLLSFVLQACIYPRADGSRLACCHGFTGWYLYGAFARTKQALLGFSTFQKALLQLQKVGPIRHVQVNEGSFVHL